VAVSEAKALVMAEIPGILRAAQVLRTAAVEVAGLGRTVSWMARMAGLVSSSSAT
jgi:hypothetical protein